MTDLELLDRFCETCLDHPHPVIFRDLEKRGLVSVINRLPGNTAEAKAVVRARISKQGRYVGDPEIEQIADIIARVEQLREDLLRIPATDVHKTIPILQEMTNNTLFLKDYFKPVKF